MQTKSDESKQIPAGVTPRSQCEEHLRIPTIQSIELFGNAREVVIQHAGQEYRLRLTRQNRLILTK